MNRILSILMVVCSTVLMQWHSIGFWTETAGISGWAWSIGLEAAMFWFWYERRLWLFKYLAAIILIAGPWYQITMPIVKNLNNVTVMQSEIKTVTETVTQLSDSLHRYELNSAGRTGWASRIDKTQNKLEAARARLSVLRSAGKKEVIPWRGYLVAGLQALALLIVLTAQLAAVSRLRSGNDSTVIKTVTVKRNKKSGAVTETLLSENYETTIIKVASEISRRLSDFGSQAKLCRSLSLRPADVSMILNYKEKKTAGDPVIGSRALQKLALALEIV